MKESKDRLLQGERGFFGRFCNNAFWGIAFTLSLCVFCLNFWYTAVISYDTYEHVTITSTPLKGLLFVLVSAAALVLTGLFYNRIKEADLKILFRVFAVIYCVMGAYLIFNSDVGLRSDALMVYDTAEKFSAGNMMYFEQGKYLHSYPHQTGLMLYNCLLRIFGSRASFNFAVNLGLIIGINYFNVKISGLLFKSKAVETITLVLSFAFLPQLFFIMFAYGLIPGLFFMTVSFYCALLFAQRGGTVYLVFTAVFSGIAVLLRKNYIIGVAAIAIYFLFLSSQKIKTRIIAAVCVILCAILPMKMILGYFELKTGNDLDNGVPTVMWIAMGTDLHNRDRAPGWYNGFNYYTYIDEGYDSAKAEKIGVERLKQNIREMKDDPKKALYFFKEKTVSMWCENTYQSMWSGPLEVCGQFTHTPLLQDIYNGGETEKGIALYCEWASQFIWLFALAFLVLYARKKEGWQLFALYFVGGLIFHTLWEGKSQYIYPYVYCLIPSASYAFCQLSKSSITVIKKLQKKNA